MYETKESDWKKYKKLVDNLEEKYLEKQLCFLVNLLEDDSKSAVDRFSLVRKQIDKSSKVLGESIGEHKRSSLFFNLLNMLRNNLICEEDLSAFSEELKETLKKVIDNFG